MRCIECGQFLQYNETTQLYHCSNVNCAVYNQPWTVKEHKDNQNWAVRHIHALEAQVKELSESILVLQKKVLS